MPVTAKLSRRFYETFGDEVANELVDWFNAVDLTYRTDLRELNELNFSRFEAKLEQAIGSLRSELREEIAALRSEMTAEVRAESLGVRSELEAFRTKFERDLVEWRMGQESLESRLRTEMAILRADLIKWMFLFWVGTVAATLAGRLL